jgi:hypothetical protein
MRLEGRLAAAVVVAGGWCKRFNQNAIITIHWLINNEFIAMQQPFDALYV